MGTVRLEVDTVHGMQQRAGLLCGQHIASAHDGVTSNGRQYLVEPLFYGARSAMIRQFTDQLAQGRLGVVTA